MGGARISPADIERATKLAGRKTGVTHGQLSDALGSTVVRAAEILRRAPLVRQRTPDRKRARLLTYFTRETHRAWVKTTGKKALTKARTKPAKPLKKAQSKKPR